MKIYKKINKNKKKSTSWTRKVQVYRKHSQRFNNQNEGENNNNNNKTLKKNKTKQHKTKLQHY
jgi:hypothetical protein